MKRKPLTEEQKERKKEIRKTNREKENLRQKLRRSNKTLTVEEKAERKEYNKNYYKKNKEKILIDTKKYRIENRGLINQSQIERRNKNPISKLKQKTRNLINKSFYNFYMNKPARTEEILGCTFEEFKLYLESKFEIWMNWDNRGLYNGSLNYGWDIDHIIPLATAVTEDDVIKLNHYSNLQPLCSYINRHIKCDNL